MNTVIAYEIVDHGFDGASYFPGCGVAFTDFDEVYTGAGNTAAEALEDAIEQALCGGDCAFPSEFTGEIQDGWLNSDWAKQESDVEDNDEWHYYVSIRVRFERKEERA